LRLTDLYVLQAASMVDRKRVEETLRRSETYLAEGQKLTHTGSWCWNVASGEMYWSREQFQILGFDPEQSAPSLAMTLQPIHPDDRSFVQQSLDKAVRERTDAEWDCRVVVGDGTIRHVHTTAHPVVNAGKLTEFLGTTMDITERKKEEEARKDLGRRLLNAQEDERRRISRELHDQLGQQLSALKWRLEALRREHAAQPHLDAQLASLQAIASQLDADVDFIAWQLRPTGLDDLGLAVALKHYVASWSEHFHIQAQLHVGGIDPNSLTDEIQTALYRILQESLNNVAKHSGATHVQILLEGHSDRVSLIVEDDGRGFDTGGAFAYGAKQLGLVGMRERAALLDGTLDVESPGRGTTVVARIPTQVRPHGKPGP
jgi:PAS domain S-box-containing protein